MRGILCLAGAHHPVGRFARGTFSNTIGAPFLTAYWKDPDFDPAERAFTYVHVLESPTPRRTTFDAARFDTPLPKRSGDSAGSRLQVAGLVLARGKLT